MVWGLNNVTPVEMSIEISIHHDKGWQRELTVLVSCYFLSGLMSLLLCCMDTVAVAMEGLGCIMKLGGAVAAVIVCPALLFFAPVMPPKNKGMSPPLNPLVFSNAFLIALKSQRSVKLRFRPDHKTLWRPSVEMARLPK